MERPLGFSRIVARSLVVIVCLVLALGQSAAQTLPELPSEPAAESTPVKQETPDEFTTPRKAFQAFMERMQRDDKKMAADLLDLSSVSPEAAAAKGPELAYKLFEVMTRLVRLPNGQPWPLTSDNAYQSIPDAVDAKSPWKLSTLNRYPEKNAEHIELVRDAEDRWRFSVETVSQIETLFLATEDYEPKSKPTSDVKTTEPFSVWFGNLFPDYLRESHFLLPNYQWLCLLLVALVGLVADWISRHTLTFFSDAMMRRSEPDFNQTTSHVWKPVGRLANAASWYWGAYIIGLPLEVVGLLLIVLKLMTIVAAVWSAFAIIELFAGYLTRRAKRDARKFDDLIVPLASSTVKAIAIIAGVLAAIAAFSGELPTALLGGLGIGGVAIALASQETLSNFFGSITVLLDRPFEVGDWVLIEGIEGEVESVGFRSTRIRTALNSQVSLPNSKLAGASVDNWGRRRYRRYLTRIGVEYGTEVDRIEAFCEGIRELIRRQPHTRKDFYAAYFNDLGASSLEILLVCYFEAPDWPTELRERHRLLADTVRLAEQLKVAFAFPTQTIHLHRDQSIGQPDATGLSEEAGQQFAADIAGELLRYQDRPGRVNFTETNSTRTHVNSQATN